jgi:hypothetical protein
VVANNTDVDINFSDGVGTAWSFSTTGMTFPDDTVQTTAYEPKYKVYTALLTQSGGDDPQTTTGGTLTIGVTYEITNIQTGDDFTNVGASSNTNGVKFVATGTTPTIWTNSSELSYNNGAPVVTVLENTLGGSVVWSYIASGVYGGILPINYTSGKLWFSSGANNNNSDAIIVYNDAYPTGTVGNVINVITLDFNGSGIDTAMYNTSIEIRVYN